jgi:hypothetical protein
MADDNPIKRIPINELRQEDSAHELATSPDMEPYLDFAMAVMQDADPTAELEAIRHLPLEKRYVWRVASASSGPLLISMISASKPTSEP